MSIKVIKYILFLLNYDQSCCGLEGPLLENTNSIGNPLLDSSTSLMFQQFHLPNSISQVSDNTMINLYIYNSFNLFVLF